MKNMLVTGGAGFIGVNFIRYVFGKAGFDGRVINVDKLTYAGNPLSLEDVAAKYGSRYAFEKADICDGEAMRDLIRKYDADTVVHFAAESHVDRSILGPADFIHTNIVGTFALLEAARDVWKDRDGVLFHHISTDEVYGSLGDTGYFREDTPYDPRSPYSASKASSDHLVMAYSHTYGLPVTLSNCSNNYGPYQFPEKLIPLMVLNAIEGKPLPVYGDGKNVRDWLYVEDHASAVFAILEARRLGEKFNVGGENEKPNLEVVYAIADAVARRTGRTSENVRGQVQFVKDRPGHDRRYAIDCSRIKKELGWKQTVDFEQGLEKTVDWYFTNREWVEKVRSGEYLKWIDANYDKR